MMPSLPRGLPAPLMRTVAKTTALAEEARSRWQADNAPGLAQKAVAWLAAHRLNH
jgi:hypothetical protein